MNDRGRPAVVQRTLAPLERALGRRRPSPATVAGAGASSGRTRPGTLLATLLVTSAAILAVVHVPSAAATPTPTAGTLQVRRTNATSGSTVDLAVLLPRSAVDVRVAQAGRDLRADTEALVNRAHPLGIVVQAKPEQLGTAQGVVADALATLPERARVRLAPLAAAGGAATSASTADLMDPSTALADLDQLVAEPSASALSRSSAQLTGPGAARAVLVVTTCPGGQVPDVGSAGTTAWVLGWGAECATGAPPASAARVVVRARDLEQALESLPAMVRQIVAARSVRVVAHGSQPLVVSASGARGTVALDRSAASPSDGADEGLTGRGLSGTTTLLALAALAAALLLAVLATLRRRSAAAALPAPSPGDDPWSRLVPEWTRTNGRHQASGPVTPQKPRAMGTPRPTGRHVAHARSRTHDEPARPDLVIDLRHPAEARREAPEGSA